MSKRYDAFLSYARADDNRFVRDLYRQLTARGFKIWWDREKMPNRGETFLQEIRRAIDESDRLIAVIGPNAVKSSYVRDEWDYAQLVCKVVVPILRKGESLDAIPTEFRRDDYTLIPPELRSFHCPDFRSDRCQVDALNELDRILRQVVIEPGQAHYVPPLPPNFLRRRDVLERLGAALLVDAFQPTTIDGASKQTAVLRGMAGTGKSVMAAAFARSISIRRSFNDGVVWLRIGQDRDLLAQLNLLLTTLKEGGERCITVKDAESLLSELLKEKRCLILLDDIWDLQQVEPIWNALGVRCRLLITTRNANIATSLNAQECVLEKLTDAAALALLSQWVERPVDELPSTAHNVIHECGNLPLALALCGALVRDRTSWHDLLAALQEADLAFITHDLVNYEHPHVMRALQASVDFLSLTQPDAPTRYSELAVFWPSPQVPEAAVLTLWCTEGNLSVRSARRLLVDLDRKSLLRLEGGAPNRNIWLHDLAWGYVRCKASELGPLDGKLLDAYKAKCPNGWQYCPNDGYFFEHLLHHLRKAGHHETAVSLLLNLEWLTRQLEATNIHTVLAGFESVAQNRELQLVHLALRKAAYILTREKAQFRSQLYGRLMSQKTQAIQWFLEQATKSREFIWLRSLSPSLTPAGDPLICTLGVHNSEVMSVSVTPNGRYVVSGSADGTIKVWDLKNNKEELSLTGHIAAVRKVAVTPDGKMIISGSDDSTLKIWLLDTGALLFTLMGHERSVRALVVTPDGRQAISGSEDGILKVWDIETGTELDTIIGSTTAITDLAVTPNNMRILFSTRGVDIAVWNLHSPPKHGILLQRQWVRYPVGAVAVSPDGKSVSASDDTILRVWDLETGAELHTFEGHTDAIESVAFSPDGRYAISGSKDATPKIWNLLTAKEERSLTGHRNSVNAVAVSPDGKSLYASDDTILRVWDLETGAELHTFEGHTDAIESVAFSPDGRYAISGSKDATLRVWDLKSGSELQTLINDASPINVVSFSTDGRRAICGSVNGTFTIWDLDTKEICSTLEGYGSPITGLVVHPDGRRIISGSQDSLIIVWDLFTGEKLFFFPSCSEPVSALAITPDGRWVISASFYAIRIWDLETQSKQQELCCHRAAIYSVEMTPDGRLVIAGSRFPIIKVWDIETGAELCSLGGHYVGGVHVSVTPDGKRVISGSADNTLRVWDLNSCTELGIFRGHNDEINAVAVTPDGRRAVSASSDRTIKIWSLESEIEQHEFSGHISRVNIIVVTPDGRHAISGAGDGRIIIWDLGAYVEERTIQAHEHRIDALAVTRDGLRIISGADGEIIPKVWDLKTGEESMTLSKHPKWNEPIKKTEHMVTYQGLSGIRIVAVTPDGRLAVSSGSSDLFLRIWDLETGTEQRVIDGIKSYVNAMTITLDGQRLVFSCGTDIQVRDLESGAKLHDLIGHTEPVTALVLAEDERSAITVARDNSLRIWDLSSGYALQSLPGQRGSNNLVAVDRYGRFVISCQYSCTLRIWNPKNGRVLTCFTAESAFSAFAIAPDGVTIIAGEDSGRISFMRLEGMGN